MKVQLEDTILTKSAKILDFSTFDFDNEAGLSIHLGKLEDMRLYQKVRVDVWRREAGCHSS